MNIPPTIAEKTTKKLHLQADHPICITKHIIYSALQDFEKFEDFSPKVEVADNFDSLRIPKDHPSRSLSDTYYYDDKWCLRTHTSAHQVPLLLKGHSKFVVTGDVYRKDDIDATHYPVFHQMEGVYLVDNPEVHLEETLAKVINAVFPNSEWHFKEDYFPFTHPSWEVETLYEGKGLEILGCGLIHPEVLDAAGIHDKIGWAFGLGLDRIAMKLFGIPDIRLFWSTDPRFLGQFKAGQITQFQSYSKYPICYKDISFWIDDTYQSRDFYDLARQIGGDLIENIELLDKFEHPKTKKKSHAYRINYRSYDKNLTNQEINDIQEAIRKELILKLPVQLR